MLGGWTTLGIILGFPHVLQITPTISDAYRSEVPTGIAPARWVTTRHRVAYGLPRAAAIHVSR